MKEEDLQRVQELSTGNFEGLKYFRARADLFDELKTEAIKIYKELEELKESHYFNKKDFFQNNFQENPVVVLRFLEWFFNLTEEDLK